MGIIKDMMNDPMKKFLEKRGIDPQRVIEQYARGKSREHIRASFRITEEQLSYIIDQYDKNKLEKIRKTALNKWKGYGLNNPLGRPKENKEQTNTKISLAEAIKNVEKGGEER